MDRLARLIFRRRRLVLAVTVVFVLFAAPTAARWWACWTPTTTSRTTARSRSSRATLSSGDRALGVARHGRPGRLGAPVDSPQAEQKIARVAQRWKHPDVAEVVAVRDGEPAELVSSDGRSTYLLAMFRTGADDDALAEELQARVEREPGVTAGGGSSRSRRSASRWSRTSRARS